MTAMFALISSWLSDPDVARPGPRVQEISCDDVRLDPDPVVHRPSGQVAQVGPRRLRAFWACALYARALAAVSYRPLTVLRVWIVCRLRRCTGRLSSTALVRRSDAVGECSCHAVGVRGGRSIAGPDHECLDLAVAVQKRVEGYARLPLWHGVHQRCEIRVHCECTWHQFALHAEDHGRAFVPRSIGGSGGACGVPRRVVFRHEHHLTVLERGCESDELPQDPYRCRPSGLRVFPVAIGRPDGLSIQPSIQVGAAVGDPGTDLEVRGPRPSLRQWARVDGRPSTSRAGSLVK